MGRIEAKFKELAAKHEKAFIAYITAGDPSLDILEELIPALEKSGVDILEIGVPFSDPTADGPAIQAAAQRALKNGVTLEAILDRISLIRKKTQMPLLLFGYYNPILAFGNKRFARKAKDAGIDGILVVDLPPEESEELRQYTDPAGIDFISLIAPTTDAKRMRAIARKASGFLYYISITGVTGTAVPVTDEIRSKVRAIRRISPLPVAVGFGISKPEQAAMIASVADGIVIGSALVQLMGEYGQQADFIPVVSSYITDIKKAISASGNM